MELDKIYTAIEAILFASGDPISVARLSDILEVEKKTVQNILVNIGDNIAEHNKGFELIKIQDEYQLVTKEETAKYVKAALDMRRDMTLSQAAFETLAIIAYNQPISRGFVEQVRGVDSTAVINNLILKNLVEESGRLDLPGRPIAYKTTTNFLRCFGISSLEELPPLPKEEVEENIQ